MILNSGLNVMIRKITLDYRYNTFKWISESFPKVDLLGPFDVPAIDPTQVTSLISGTHPWGNGKIQVKNFSN